jgi:hypothetical protein
MLRQAAALAGLIQFCKETHLPSSNSLLHQVEGYTSTGRSVTHWIATSGVTKLPT